MTKPGHLIATRGLPGCGKTTRARVWVSHDPANRARINRDDLRAMLHDGYLNSDDQELQITAAAHGAVDRLLRLGVHVVCDDTNLLPEYVDQLRRLAGDCGATFEVWDMTDVPVDVCIRRDEERALDGGQYIGEKQIRAMHAEFLRRNQPATAQNA